MVLRAWNDVSAPMDVHGNMADVGADEASRYPHARSRVIRAGTIAECIRRGTGDTRTLMGGLDATRKGAAYVLPNSLTALLFYPQ